MIAQKLRLLRIYTSKNLAISTSRLLVQNGFHTGFLYVHAHVSVETQGRVVAFPYIECDIITAYGAGIVTDVLI